MEDYLSEFVIDVRNINQENNKYRVSILKETSFIDDFVYAEIKLNSTEIDIQLQEDTIFNNILLDLNLSNKYYMNSYHTSSANYETNKKTKGFILSDNLLIIDHMNTTTRLRESLPIQPLQIYSNSEQLTHNLICKNSCCDTCEIYVYLTMREALRELFVENGPCTVLDVEYCNYCEYDSRKWPRIM